MIRKAQPADRHFSWVAEDNGIVGGAVVALVHGCWCFPWNTTLIQELDKCCSAQVFPRRFQYI